MSEQTQEKYMLLFRGNEWQKNLSPEDMQKIAGQWMAWFNRLTGEGTALAGSPLEREGKVVSARNGKVVDGPFVESKETIGGYFLLRVKNLDEAVAIARECPGVPYGAVVEVRAVAEECPLIERAQAEPRSAAATA